MKIIPVCVNSLNPSKNDFAKNQTFGSGVSQNSIQADEIPSKNPEYNIKAPISYSLQEKILLPDNLTANYYKLSNGQKVIIIPKKGSTVVKSYVNTGSLNEPDDVRGISHYIEHNLFNGSEALGDKVFFEEVNKMGASTNASTSFSVTDYYIESQLLDDNDLENKIKLHSGMLQTPKFLEEKLKKEKSIVNSEINMYLSDDYSKAESLTLKKLFNIESSSDDLVAGSTDNIDALTRDDVVNYFNKNYYPANTVTVISGEVDPDETMKLVSKYFTSTKIPPQSRHYQEFKPIEKTIRQDLISEKTQNGSQIILGFAGPKNSDFKDKIYLHAIDSLLLSLANSRLNNLSKIYGAHTVSESERLGTRHNDPTARIFSINANEENVEPILKEIYRVFSDLSKNPPTKDELETVKNNIKKRNAIIMQSSEALNYHIGMDFLNGCEHSFAQYNSVVDSINPQDLMKVFNKYYDLDKAVITVVHPSKTTEAEVQNNYKKAKSQVSFTGLNKKTPIDMNKITEYKMPNNFDVIFDETDNDVINYTFSYNLKSHPQKKYKPAVYDVLNYILLNGTSLTNQNRYNTVRDKNAVNVEVAASSHSLTLYGDFPKDNINSALALFKEKLLYPNFTNEALGGAIHNCTLDYLKKEPSATEVFKKAIYPETYYTTAEKLQSLADITLDDVKNAYNDIISNAQGTVTVSAPFGKMPELKNKIFNEINSFNPVKPKNNSLPNEYKSNDKIQLFTVETKRNQAQIVEGFKFKRSGNAKDDMSFTLLNMILGGGPSSRLFNDLREKRHLCYGVFSNYSKSFDTGLMTLQIGTTTNNSETGENTFDNIQKSIEGFNENIEKLKTEKVSQAELDYAKKKLKTEILSNLEMNADKNSIINSASKTPYNLNIINERLNIIDSITTDDIYNCANYIFSNKPVYSISGTKEAINANKEFLNLLVKN